MLRISIILVADTFREALARKIFWGLFALSTLMIGFFLFLLKIDVVEGAMATVSLFGGAIEKTRTLNVDKLVRDTHAFIATFLYTWGMFLAVFASSGLVPSVLEPGRIELLLSKPVRRWHVLLGRFLGNLLVVGANIAYLVAGVWLVFGVKTGVWATDFLGAIASTLFVFAVLLTVVIWIGVVFESAALATMVTVALMILSPILAQTKLMEKLLSSEWSRRLWRTLYECLPKVYDLGRMTLDMARRQPLGDLTPIWSSALFGLVMLGSAMYIFSKRNF